MDWLSGLKVMSNEQGQLFSVNNLGRDELFVPIFQLLVTQKEKKKIHPLNHQHRLAVSALE